MDNARNSRKGKLTWDIVSLNGGAVMSKLVAIGCYLLSLTGARIVHNVSDHCTPGEENHTESGNDTANQRPSREEQEILEHLINLNRKAEDPLDKEFFIQAFAINADMLSICDSCDTCSDPFRKEVGTSETKCPDCRKPAIK
jgi:hypothetical protein